MSVVEAKVKIYTCDNPVCAKKYYQEEGEPMPYGIHARHLIVVAPVGVDEEVEFFSCEIDDEHVVFAMNGAQDASNEA